MLSVLHVHLYTLYTLKRSESFNTVRVEIPLTQNYDHLTDINECDEGISGCSDLCHNDIGFFHCLCNEGYLLSPEDNVTCYGEK